MSIPGDTLTTQQAERLWSTDRAALIRCKNEKDGVVKFYRKRDIGLAGTPPR